MGLQVKLPMILWRWTMKEVLTCSTIGALLETQEQHVRELKEAGMFEIKWIEGEDNESDPFTENVDGTTFWKHASVFHGHACNDEGMEEEECWSDDVWGTQNAQKAWRIELSPTNMQGILWKQGTSKTEEIRPALHDKESQI